MFLGPWRAFAAALVGAMACACGHDAPSPAKSPAATPHPAVAPRIVWQEHFDQPPLDWVDPFDHPKDQLAQLYGVKREDGLWFLHARHDARADDRVPSMDLGKPFPKDPVPLEKIRALRWRWRALQQPAVTDDPWLDMAVSLYVVIKTPSLLFPGKGFKFGWLAKPGPRGTYQHGLLQIELEHGAGSKEWRSESVDLCALFRAEYGECEGQHLLYVGVTTDADNTRSVAEGDYADFELLADP